MDDSKYNAEFTKMVNIMVTRWDKITIPLHCLGFVLTTRFCDHAYLNAPAPRGYVRRAPIEDREVVLGCLEAFKKIPKDSDE